MLQAVAALSKLSSKLVSCARVCGWLTLTQKYPSYGESQQKVFELKIKICQNSAQSFKNTATTRRSRTQTSKEADCARARYEPKCVRAERKAPRAAAAASRRGKTIDAHALSPARTLTIEPIALFSGRVILTRQLMSATGARGRRRGAPATVSGGAQSSVVAENCGGV